MTASQFYKEKSTFSVTYDSELLFTIRADGTIERGPGFTTEDEMSLRFWEAIERQRRPLPPLMEEPPPLRADDDD
jgi:hypothetical protein